MDDPFVDRLARKLAGTQSRRKLFQTAGRGTITALGIQQVVTSAALAAQPAPYVRPNVHGPDANLAAFAEGVRQMKLLPRDDPRSWLYQANIHKTRDIPVLALWNTCQHHTDFFWAWHRMELYWFEQIVRQLSGDPTFALPYWDYSNPTQRYLPAPFRDRESPLYERERRQQVNDNDETSAPPVDAMFSYCRGLAQGDFGSWGGGPAGLPQIPGAQLTLESDVHDKIHGWVGGGGLMSRQTTAARDPVFWIHHANIDRLWSSWRSITLDGALHTNPTDPAWLATKYEFFDASGVKISPPWPVSSVLETTAARLNYAYEELAGNAWFELNCPGFPRPLPAPAIPATPGPAASPVPEAPSAAPQAPREIGANAPEGGIALGAGSVDVPVTLAQPDFAGSPAATPEALPAGALVLTVDGVESTGVAGVAVDIYINSPPGQTPDPASPSYVGSIGSFGLLPEDMLGEHAGHSGATRVFDLSQNIAALEASGGWTGELVVTFVGNELEFPPSPAAATPEAVAGALAAPPGTPGVESSAWFTIAGVSIAAR